LTFFSENNAILDKYIEEGLKVFKAEIDAIVKAKMKAFEAEVDAKKKAFTNFLEVELQGFVQRLQDLARGFHSARYLLNLPSWVRLG
jgi:hypothetical protein